LQQGATQFKRGASKVRKQMWWKDMKLKIMIAAIVVILLTIIIGKLSRTVPVKIPLTLLSLVPIALQQKNQ
jgi:vesicle-associated membrane protein 4